MSTMQAEDSKHTERKTFLGHPRGLIVLFFAEMWERFSYYGMRGLLIFYLTWHFLYDQKESYSIYGAYVALVYLLPVLGGYIADKYLGFRKAVACGAILLTLGHGVMGFHGLPGKEYLNPDGQSRYEITRSELYDADQKRHIIIDDRTFSNIQLKQLEETAEGRWSVTYSDPDSGETIELTGTIEKDVSNKSLNILFLALALIVVGVGFLKPNISTCVGALYDQGDTRRDAGFTLYYMGINIGAALASLTVGLIGFKYGWAYGFGLAAIGMLLGLVVFIIGQPWLEGRAEPKDPALLKKPVLGPLNREWLIYISGIVCIAISWLLLQYTDLVDITMHITTAVMMTGVVVYALWKLNAEERDRILVLMLLVISSVLFWALFEQAPVSLNVFAAEHVASNFLFFKNITPPQLQAFNPIFIIFFAMFFTSLWTWLSKKGKEPHVVVKFALGMIQIGLGYWVLNLGISMTDVAGGVKVAIIWVGLMYMLHTTGELCVSPVGLSAVTKLSPAKIVSLMMGIWFLATSYAQIIAKIISQATVVPVGTDPVVSIALYNKVYFYLGLSAVALGIVLLLASPFLHKLSHGRD